MRLIDGDALIEKFNEKTDLAECLVDARAAKRFATFCALADAVEEMPTVDAAPVVRGWWVRKNQYDKESSVICSVCGRMFDYIDGVCYLVSGSELPFFCPACGAKMDGKEDKDG